MSWTGRRVLVTGAAGFIGSHLCEALVRAGADVTAMIHYSSRGDWGNLEFLSPEDRSSLRVVAGNIEDAGFVARQVKDKEVVFHLAALIAIPYSYVAPMSYVHTNIEGTVNVLEAARSTGSRVVHTSTSEVYGTARYTPIDEGHPLQGQSPYSASKIAADKLAESYHLAFDLPVTTIRPFNTYGPRQSARAIVPTVIAQALTQPVIRLGALTPVRDLSYVKDTVEGFLRVGATDAGVGTTINIGSGDGITVGDLAVKILTLVGSDKPIEVDAERLRPVRSEVYTLICNRAKALELTGWEPRHSLDQGLAETIAFVAAHLHLFRPSTYAL